MVLGTIIILNGPSASGKSSVQHALQQKFMPFYLRMGIDSFFDALIATPDLSSFEKTKQFEQWTNEGELIRRVTLTQDTESRQIVPLEIGPAGDRIISGMHHAIAAYARQGNNIIVDYILYKMQWIGELTFVLKEFNVYLVGFITPLNIIEERERKRATSPIGHARSHFYSVHAGMMYDIEIDTSQIESGQCADTIVEFICHNPNPTTFKKLIGINKK